MDGALTRDFVLYLRKSNGRKAVPRQRVITTGHITDTGGRITAEFADADRTAFRKPGGNQPVRDGFAAMLEVLRANPGLGVAAWHADRLTRNDEDTAALIRVCGVGDHLVVTPSGGTYDLATANGRKRLRDDASAAIYEVDHNRERVLAGRAEVAAEGRWLGGKRPFGWEPEPNPVDQEGEPWLDDDGKPKKGILRLRSAEADALAWGLQAILGGASVHGVAREWNARGVLTPTGKQWSSRETARVLRRPRNAGLMEHNGTLTPGASWPAVVDETTWRGAAAILSDPSRRTTPGPAPRHLLSFIARCGECGGPMICTSTTVTASPGKRRLVYRCRDDGPGRHPQRAAEHLDELIIERVVARLSQPDAADVLAKPDDGRKEQLAHLYQEKAAIEAVMEERDKLHRRRVITDKMLIEGLAELQEELAGVEQRIAGMATQDVISPLLADPARVWEEISLDQRRAVIQALMTITVKPSAKGRPSGWKPGQPYFRASSIDINYLR
jgi:site-specific DNA recombinase